MDNVIVEAIRSWFQTCPLINSDNAFFIDGLRNEQSYSIDIVPCDPTYKRYVDGMRKLQYQFEFASKEPYDGDARTTIDNSMFYDQLLDWVRAQSDAGNFPEIQGHTVERIDVLSSGYIYGVDADLARYVAEFKLIYL